MGTTNLINAAAAWNAGAANSSHELKTGPLGLLIVTPNLVSAMEIARDAGGTELEGTVQSYNKKLQ